MRRMKRTTLALTALTAAAASTFVLAGSAGATSISGIVLTGPAAPGPCATATVSTLPTTSWSGTLGCWTDGFGPEPLGYSQLTATATGTGSINFTWRFRTTDTISFDYVQVFVDGVCRPPSSGASCRYNPNPALGNQFNSGWVNASLPVSSG